MEQEKINLYDVNKRSLNKVYDYTLEVLRTDKESRSDDAYLYFKVCDLIAPNGVSTLLFEDVMMNRIEYRLPNYATVVRCRRKIFEDYPGLKPDNKTQAIREKQEQRIKEFVKEKKQ